MRDELGLSAHLAANPLQAALASAASFAVGAALPLAMVPIFSGSNLPWAVSIAALLFLALLGFVGAKLGGAPIAKSVLRVAFWGAAAMAATAAIGSIFGTSLA
jgi:vacuolar iron transporter family protein